MGHLSNSGKKQAWQHSYTLFLTTALTSLLTTLLLSGCGPGTTSTSTGTTITTSPATSPPIKPTLPLTSIHMLDNKNGWALTRQSILFTTDGGTHWKDISPPNLSAMLGTNGLGSLRSGTFFDASTAWISLVTKQNTIQILRTVNGGQHWDAITLPGSGNPDRARFINAQDGWIEIHRSAAAGSEEVDIYQTTDGGLTWNKVSGTGHGGNTPPGSLLFGGDKTGISFKDATTGWATGEVARTDYFWLYVTHDGGKTWQHQEPPLLADITNAAIVTTPPVFFGNTGFLPVSVSTSDNQLEILYVTHDGGTTWQSTTPLPANTSNVYIFDAHHAWGNKGNTFYSTSDGGQHWSTSTSTIQNGVSGMSFISSTTGWAIGNSDTNEPLLFKTMDGGQTWAKINYTIE